MAAAPAAFSGVPTRGTDSFCWASCWAVGFAEAEGSMGDGDRSPGAAVAPVGGVTIALPPRAAWLLFATSGIAFGSLAHSAEPRVPVNGALGGIPTADVGSAGIEVRARRNVCGG